MDIRREAIELLATPRSDTRFVQTSLPARIVERCSCRPHQAYEALWGLLAEGLVFVDPAGQPSTDNWHWRLSEDGLRAAGGGSWEPSDREGFLRRLRRHQPPVDQGAFVYLDEALRSFNARCYLSATVMLGVAVEHVFVDLARAAVAAEPGRGTKLQEALDKPTSNQRTRFDLLRKVLEPIRPQLPDRLADPITLDSIADLLRTSRNDAGHPTGIQVDEDTSRLHLISAAVLIAKMTDLRAHFAQAVTAARRTAQHGSSTI